MFIKLTSIIQNNYVIVIVNKSYFLPSFAMKTTQVQYYEERIPFRHVMMNKRFFFSRPRLLLTCER